MGGNHGGKGKIGGKGNPYKGPGDIVPPGGDDDDEPAEPEAPPPLLFTPPRVFTPVAVPVPVGAVHRKRVPAVLDDMEWTLWWDLQRWNPLEPPSHPEPGRPVTPDGVPSALEPGSPGEGQAARVALPALLEAWKAGPSQADTRAALLPSLARVGRGPAIGGILRKGLADTDERVIEAAALALGILREPHSIPVLTDLVLDTPAGRRAVARHQVPQRTRAFAAYGLGLIASACPYQGLRETVAATLQAGSGPSPTRDLPAACIQALGLFPGEDASELVPGLLEVLRDGRRSEWVRAQAPQALAKLLARQGGSSAGLLHSVFGELRERLLAGNESTGVRQSCALALGRLGTLASQADGSAKALIEALKDKGDPRIRHLAALALGEIGATPHPAGQTLALPALLEGLTRGTDVNRSWCALGVGWSAVLSRQRGRPIPAGLGQHLLAVFPHSAQPRTQAMLSLALGLCDHRPAAAVILPAVDGIGKPAWRAEAAAGASLLGGPGAEEVVLREMDRIDPFTPAFQAACEALGHADPGLLFDHFSRAVGNSSFTYEARLPGAIALGWLRNDPGAATLLVHLMNEKVNYLVRVAAVVSLGRIAERPGPRWNQGYLDLLNPYAAPPTLVGDALRPGVANRL